ncbi:hypothetical protein CERZMDRAFT_100946 [Cercospora zeae-maydis SCOH1-5]|uniref:Tautomerase cis-CaaD-like domain-containing protein n=1 Tax=Cercospora zeae-maydis SCOH1-5 TaxID=717836 RepID=A0A6A6F8C7_9PEZI|nr:hypothetical protein CERZMDRAFT_100946 [Cercospora zeae-maydis SCOH1-5]
MPLYEIRHTTPLSPSQHDALAQGLTTLHSTRFTTPKLFVNVLFTPFANVPYYAGGDAKQSNHIIANVRTGPSRSQEDWDALSRDVVKLWEDVVGRAEPGEGGAGKELHSLFILGGMVGGYEAGFLIPAAGGDQKWLEENWTAFEEKAKRGDRDFEKLIQEVKERGLL